MEARHGQIIFVTGTDTGVGKTVFTAALLHYFRTHGCNALAMKPFCTGSRADAELLQAFQPEAGVSLNQVNPFFYQTPVAPWVAARRERRYVLLPTVLAHIRAMARCCSILLVEGVGGLLVPLGRTYTVLDLIAALDCRVVLVSRNALGTVNHTLLSAEALRSRAIKSVDVVLMDQPHGGDRSMRTNAEVIRKWLHHTMVLAFPFLGAGASRVGGLKAGLKKFPKSRKVLASFGSSITLRVRSFQESGVMS